MSSTAIFEEIKVRQALELLRKNPRMSVAEAARQSRASYNRVLRRRKGTPASNSRGGQNKKLLKPQEYALKDYVLFYYYVGRNAGIKDLIIAVDRLLAFDGRLTSNGDLATVLRR